ncbi:hypothetical protein SNE40_000630 [Patella caerulea]|uniref:Uncharacterized protein n=1 Tax=Patella caerulea TaxID=87958 RepID=A0AAN8Q1S1_PATCE
MYGGRHVPANPIGGAALIQPITVMTAPVGNGTDHVLTEIPQYPLNYAFIEVCGLKVRLQDGDPSDYFHMVVTQAFIDTLVTETKCYAAAEINKLHHLRRQSRLKDWKDTEMKQFIALFLKNKRHKFVMKLYKLCEPCGLLAKNTATECRYGDSLGQSAQIVIGILGYRS